MFTMILHVLSWGKLHSCIAVTAIVVKNLFHVFTFFVALAIYLIILLLYYTIFSFDNPSYVRYLVYVSSSTHPLVGKIA